MQIFMILAAVTMIGFVPNSVSADEFGDRFYNQAPQGLGDYTAEDVEVLDIAMDDIAESLQDIMPAAGDEELTSDLDTEDSK
ncbi:MAG: hypothetical protein COA45_10435 [Zetaproteobacteria bacterium]|nr:MAG: hypothetical protein COA45_10435 [Zetaproteobacteria bacterium]